MITATIVSFLILFDRSAITLPKAKRLFRQSAAIVQRDTGIKVVPSGFHRVKGVPRIQLQHQVFALGIYQSFFPATTERTILFAPPGQKESVPDREYSMGQARVCGNRGYCTVIKNGNWLTNVTVATHEMGHMLGASHVHEENFSVMNPYAPEAVSKNNWKIYFARISREEIEKCQSNGGDHL